MKDLCWTAIICKLSVAVSTTLECPDLIGGIGLQGSKPWVSIQYRHASPSQIPALFAFKMHSRPECCSNINAYRACANHSSSIGMQRRWQHSSIRQGLRCETNKDIEFSRLQTRPAESCRLKMCLIVACHCRFTSHGTSMSPRWAGTTGKTIWTWKHSCSWPRRQDSGSS